MTCPLYCLITYVVLFPNQISIFAKNINIVEQIIYFIHNVYIYGIRYLNETS